MSYAQTKEPEYSHFSIEAEQALIGAAFINNHALDMVTGLVRPEHFHEELHQQLWMEMVRLREIGRTVTPVTVKDSFPELKIGPSAGAGMSLNQYLARLCAEATTVINAPDYAELIRANAVLRDIVRVGDDARFSKARGISTEEALKTVWDALDRIRLSTADDGKEKTFMFAQSAEHVVNHFTDIIQGRKKLVGVMTGLIDLDHRIGGLMRGDLVLAAGRPGMGKSTFASSVARHIAVHPDAEGRHAVGLFSFEMPEMQTTSRLLSDHIYGRAPVEYQKILRGNLTNDEAEQVVLGQRSLADVPLILDYSSKLTVPQIVAKVRQMQHGAANRGASLDLVVLDYLKFITPSDRYAGNTVREIGETTGLLKQAAKDLDTCIMLLVQLNRKVEERENRRPMLSDLRDSGELEQDADVVLLFYREAYYIQTNPNIGTDLVLQDRLAKCASDLDVITAKQRNGPTGIDRLWCSMPHAAIRNSDHARHMPDGWAPPIDIEDFT